MKKFLKNIFLLLAVIVTAMLCFAFSASAETWEDYEYELLDDGTVEITKYKGNDQNLTIPQNIAGKRVTSIYYSAFYNREGLIEVTVPDGVKSIKRQAFYYCINLEKIVLPESLTSIDDLAFYGCKNLKQITIPMSVTSIGEDVFKVNFGKSPVIYCKSGAFAAEWAKVNGLSYVLTDGTDKESIFSGTAGKIKWTLDKRTGVLNLTGNGNIPSFAGGPAAWHEYLDYVTSVKIGKGITAIGISAFYQHYRLKNASLPEGIKSLELQAFCGCSDLEEINLPKSLTSIGNSAFLDCKNLENIVLPDNLETIEHAAFVASGIKSIKIPRGVTTLNGVFRACENLTSVTLPETLTGIGFGTFEDCKNLKNVTIPKKITVIDHYVFAGCESLTIISIPENVKKIEHNAFDGCKNLKELKIYSRNCEIVSTCGIGFESTVYGYKGSTAEKFADEVGAKFVTMKEKHSHTYTNDCDAKCNGCDAKRTPPHSYKSVKITAANLKKDGNLTKKCKYCGDTKKITICKVKSIKLSSAAITYNGKTKTPSVTVKDSNGKTLKKGTDYTVTYPRKRKSIGKYTVTVTFKGNYSGTKKLTFEIVPAKVTLSKLTAGSKNLTATWKTVSGATGYEVVYSTSKKFTKKTTKTVTIKKAKTKKTTIKKLKKGKKYYVKVRAYKTVSGKKIYSAYSAVKSVKVK